MTPALLGPMEAPLGAPPGVRDSERRQIYSQTLPGTLRPTTQLERAQVLKWQPSTRQAAWAATPVGPAPITQRPAPMPGENRRPRVSHGRPPTARQRVLQRSHRPQTAMPVCLSQKQKGLQAAYVAPVSATRLQKQVASLPGASFVGRMRDLNALALPRYEVKAQRSQISTRIGAAHGGARMRLQWVGRH